MSHREPDAQISAVKALINLGTVEAQEALRRIVRESSDHTVRKVAMTAFAGRCEPSE